MTCEIEKKDFEDKMIDAQARLKRELEVIKERTEAETEALSEEFKDKNELAQGVGAAAGTAIGSSVGPGGAVAGGVVGKAIGTLFVIEFGETDSTFSLDLPTVAIQNQEWSFDIPEITIKENDIIFDMPTLVMKTVEGPSIPEPGVESVEVCVDIPILGKKCTWVPQPTVTWKKTYIDVPTWENREIRIVLGIPEVTMKRQLIVVGIPEN